MNKENAKGTRNDSIDKALKTLKYFESSIAPLAKKYLAEVIRGKPDLPPWPNYCFIPTKFWHNHFREVLASDLHLENSEGVRPDPEQMMFLLVQSACLFAWRMTKSVYRFDDMVFDELVRTDSFREIPEEVLLRLPEWSVFIDLSGRQSLVVGDQRLIGTWVSLDYDIDEACGRLIIVPLKDYKTAGKTQPGLLQYRLNGETSVSEVVLNLEKEGDVNAEFYKRLFCLIPFLCTDEPDIEEEGAPDSFPTRPVAKRVKKGLTIFPAMHPRIWQVGTRMGRRLKQMSVLEQGRSTRPHMRRAHYHGVWTGPKNGEQKMKFNWWPPTPVGGRVKPESFD